MDINDISSSKIIKSSTLNRHQVNKPKSPGIEHPSHKNLIREHDLLSIGNIFKKLFRRRRSTSR